MYDVETMRKRLTPAELIHALHQVPSDLLLECNQVGNLLITDADYECLGFIDFMRGEVIFYGADNNDEE